MSKIPKYTTGDLVMVVGGKYKGHRAFVMETKPKMVVIQLLTSLVQVRVMLHNVALISSDNTSNIIKSPIVDAKDSTFTPECRDNIVQELLQIRKNIDSLVVVFSKLKF
jgi:hypothetical protein